MKNPHKALEAIETLVGGDFGMDMEWLLNDTKKVDKRLKQAAEVITKIYMIAHAETLHACSHPDWEDIKFKILKDSLEDR